MHPDDKTLMDKVGETESLKLEGVKENDIPLNMSLKDFIHKFWTDWNERLATQKVSGAIHCMPGKGRSITDLFLLADYYYPGVRYNQVKDEVLSFGTNLRGHYCPDVERRICSHVDIRPRWGQYGQDELDEHGESIYYLDNEGNKLEAPEDGARAYWAYKGYPEDTMVEYLHYTMPRLYEFYDLIDIRYSFDHISVGVRNYRGQLQTMYISRVDELVSDNPKPYTNRLLKDLLYETRMLNERNFIEY